MPTLLVVHHSPTPLVERLTEAVLAGARHDEIEDVDVVVRPALETTSDDVLAADGYLLGTTANFGYMSGALKHVFDTTFRDAEQVTRGRPFGLWVHGRYDTEGAVRSVLSITTGLDWQQAADVVAITGDVDESHIGACTELGGTLAALLSA